ncbi:phosphate-starvation-inducible PsiE family protein [Mycolicibacterium sp. ELW1]|uniref:phosphate-starvation-inducible PsiE family protein n=1 Tax=Mycobacteriaceae TaxID=1762 RepID=UPI002570C329|nr:phosphate-starvation-inducible PsiE family protein [Mycobacterium sp. ELW1]
MSEDQTIDETPDEQERQRLADRVLSVVEDVLYWAIAVLLIAGSVSLLVAQITTLLKLRDAATSTVMLELLDGLLLIFIFVELLYAVRTSLRSHEIAVEPFLVVGILACLKEIVVQSVEAAKLLDDGPQFARAIVQTGVLGGLVLVLVVASAVWVRRHRQPAKSDPA